MSPSPRRRLWLDRQGIVHTTYGSYGATSLMLCEVDPRTTKDDLIQIHGRLNNMQAADVDMPVTCLGCLTYKSSMKVNKEKFGQWW
jgi:hypothetical protein